MENKEKQKEVLILMFESYKMGLEDMNSGLVSNAEDVNEFVANRLLEVLKTHGNIY